MENKQQMFHVASEIVVLVGITFYFNQKNKKLMGHIEDLSQRVEEQEDIIQKHEQIIRKLLEIVNQQQALSKTDYNTELSQPISQYPFRPYENVRTKRTKSTNFKENNHKDSSLISNKETNKNQSIQVSFKTDKKKQEELLNLEISSLSGNESDDLDAELFDELEELKETKNDDFNLKKEH